MTNYQTVFQIIGFAETFNIAKLWTIAARKLFQKAGELKLEILPRRMERGGEPIQAQYPSQFLLKMCSFPFIAFIFLCFKM